MSKAEMHWRSHAAALVSYAVLTIGFFWQAIFLPEVTMPRGGGDLVSFIYPHYSFAADSIQRGVFPLWNPHLFAGSPFAADVQSGVFYPPNLLAFVLARPFSLSVLQWLAISHYFLAAVFGYSYGRVLSLGWTGAFAGGLVFGFGGFLVAHLGHYNMLAAAVWLPATAGAFTLSLRHRSLGWAAAASALYAVSILAGHTQIALYTALFLCWVWAWESASAVLGKIDADDTARIESAISLNQVSGQAGSRLAILGLVLGLSLLASAVLLWPSIELARHSIRADITYAQAIEYSASPIGLITLIIPHFFGNNPAEYWGLRWALHEVYGYVGVSTMVLAGLGLLSHRRSQTAWFLATTAAMAILLSFADYTILHGWLYRLVPGFDKVRAAGRFLLLFNCAIALLAGLGVRTLWVGIRRRNRPVARSLLQSILILLGAAVAIALPLGYHALITSQDKDPVILQRVVVALESFVFSLVCVAGASIIFAAHIRRWRPRAIACVAVLLIVVDLFSANARFNPTTEDTLAGYHHPEVVEFLQANSTDYRFDSVTGIAATWQPNLALLRGLEDVGGLFNPLQLADYHYYWESLGSRSVPAYDLLNARYLVAFKDVQLDWSRFQPVLIDAPRVNVYENQAVLPRAFVVPYAEIVQREEMLDRLRQPEFEPKQVVLIEPSAEHRPTGDYPLVSQPIGANVSAYTNSVEDVLYPTPNEVVVYLTGNGGGYLVLSQVYYPGWRALVDGTEQPLWRGNYVFQTVLLPEGARQVRFIFDPVSLRVGLGLSVGGWLLIMAIVVVGLLRSKMFSGDKRDVGGG